MALQAMQDFMRGKMPIKHCWILIISIALLASCVTVQNGEKNPIDEKTERKISDLENRFATIKQHNWQVSPEEYAEIKEKLKELEGISDKRFKNFREEFSRLKVGGIGAIEELAEENIEAGEQISQHETSQAEQTKHKEQKLKSVQNPGYTERIDISDGVAASLSRDRVISVVNVENPALPSVMTTINTNAFAEAIYKNNNYYYIGDSRQFQIVDKIGNEPIGAYAQNFWVAALTVNQGYAYLVAGDKLLILDVKNPKNMKKISETSLTGRAPADIIVKNGHAYVVETLGGLNIIDVTDPANPKVVKVIPFESHTAGFAIAGNYAYLGRIISTKSNSQGYSQASVLEIIDISVPASASVMSSIEIPTDIRDLDVKDKYAYVIGSFPYRLSVIDISSPGSPVMLKVEESIVGGADLQEIVVENGYAFIADGIAGLRILDVNNPAKPRHLKDFDLQGRAFNVYKSGNDLYVGVEKKYFNLADVSNPEEPKQMHSESFTSSYEYTSIVVDNKKLYFNAGGARIYDISNPKNPEKLNKNPVEADSIQIQDNYLYSTIGEIGLLVYDISDLTLPKLVSKTPFPMGIPRDLSVDMKWAVGISNSPYSISVFDISNPANPSAKQSYKYERYPNSVSIKDNYVYVARAEDGVDIIGVNDDGSLELVKNIPANGGYAHYATVSGKKAFVIKDGADIYNISDPKNPVFLNHIDSNGEAVRAVVDNGYIYFADGYAGITIAKI